ncbi:hypothetical protein [Homoserinimonas sp. A520]
MTKRWARVIRGQAVAVFATFAAALSHGVADGGHPPIAAIALALAFSSVACVVLAARHFSRRRLAASVAISQLIYHGLFSLFGTAGSTPGAVVVGHHGSLSFAPTASGQSPAALSHAVSSDLWMLAAHLGAAVLTFALAVRGERSLMAVRRVAELVVAAVFVGTLRWPLPHIPDRVPASRRFPTGQRAEIPHRQLILTSSLTHRGPPAGLRFA